MNEIDADFFEGVSKAETEPTPPTPEPTPAPTEQPTTSPLITEAQKWRKYLSQFPDPDTARKQITEKAKLEGWNKQTGYRAIHQIKTWKNQAVKAKVPTFKIARATIPEPEPEIEPDINPDPTPQPPPQPTPPQPQQAFQYSAMPLDAQQKLDGIIERNAGKAVDNVMEIVGSKLGVTEKGEAFLDATEKQDLALLLPFIIADVTKQAVTPEQTKTVAYGCFAGNLITKAIKNRLNKQPEPEKPKPEPPAAEKPAPATAEPPAPEQPPIKDSRVRWKDQLPK